MSYEQDKIQSFGENRLTEFQKDRQEKFLLDELQGIQEETQHNCDHSEERIRQWGHEYVNEDSFLVEKCEVCGEEMIIPEQYEDYESF